VDYLIRVYAVARTAKLLGTKPATAMVCVWPQRRDTGPPRHDAAHVNQDRAVDVVSTAALSHAAFLDLNLSSN
jgi:hypothetical protein